MSLRFPHARTRGFSLTELLVTLTIIVVLAALTVPAVRSSMESSRQAKCASNLRQISLGLLSYAAENNGRLPPTSTVTSNIGEETTWGRAIWTYVGYNERSFSSPANDLLLRSGAVNENVFRCPSTRQRAIPNPAVGTVNSNRYSYGLNFSPLVALGYAGDAKWTAGIPLSVIPQPTTTALVTEDSFCRGDWWGYRIYYGLIPHNQGSNVLYFDGHVQWMRPADMPDRESDPFWSGGNSS